MQVEEEIKQLLRTWNIHEPVNDKVLIREGFDEITYKGLVEMFKQFHGLMVNLLPVEKEILNRAASQEPGGATAFFYGAQWMKSKIENTGY